MKDTVLLLIGKKVPTQKKKIERFLSDFPSAEIELANFLTMYKPFLDKEGIAISDIVDSYLTMINQIVHARLEFIRTGCYPAYSQETAFQDVYTNKKTMQQYMLGLALSYFLWKHHFALLTFYKDTIRQEFSGKRFLEVGCGHGLFLVELLKITLSGTNVDVVDISVHSIDLTQKLLSILMPKVAKEVSFHLCDIFKFETENKYDFITVGEVLEHVEKPLELLILLSELLAPGGRLFITTCANCPAIDHVYHFKSVQEIRDLIKQAGFTIKNEIIAPSEDKSKMDLEKYKIDISFAATLIKATP